MAGTLTISTLSDGTNSTSSTNCIQGSAKAWVQFAGTTGTISASYNVSSVTRSATGNFTVNFTNAFADNKYLVCQAATNSGTNSGNWVTTGTPIVQTYIASTKSTTSINLINMYGTGSAAIDNVEQGVACLR